MSVKSFIYTFSAPVVTGGVGLAVDNVLVSGLTALFMTGMVLASDKSRFRAFTLAAGVASSAAVLGADYKQSLDRGEATAHLEMTTPRVTTLSRNHPA